MKKNRRAALALPQARRFLAAIKGQGRAACAVAAEAGDERGGAKDAACRARRARRKAAGLPASNAKSGAKQPVSPCREARADTGVFARVQTACAETVTARQQKSPPPPLGKGPSRTPPMASMPADKKTASSKQKEAALLFAGVFAHAQTACAEAVAAMQQKSASLPLGKAAVPAAANGVNTGKQKNRVLKIKGGGFAFCGRFTAPAMDRDERKARRKRSLLRALPRARAASLACAFRRACRAAQAALPAAALPGRLPGKIPAITGPSTAA